MALFLTGEDGCTLYVLSNEKYLSQISEDLNFKIIEDIWIRPSFGRAAGKSGSGFGEPDAMIVGMDKKNQKRIVFIESKFGGFKKLGNNEKDLRYQFYLKIALLSCIKKINGSAQKYYCVEAKQKDEISRNLCDYYREYKKKKDNENRTSEWRLSTTSENSPALRILADNIKIAKFSFYALGFTKRKFQKPSGKIENLFPRALPTDILKILSFDENFGIKYRIFSIKGNELKLDLPKVI